MGFEKGNNLGQGRPPGSTNKITAKVREVFGEFPEKLCSEIESIADINERVRLRIEVLKLIVPRPRPDFEDGEELSSGNTNIAVTDDQLMKLVKIARGDK